MSSWFAGWRLLVWVLLGLIVLTLLLSQTLTGGTSG